MAAGALSTEDPAEAPPRLVCPWASCSVPFVCRYVIVTTFDQGARRTLARTRYLTVCRGILRGVNRTPFTTRYAALRRPVTIAMTYLEAPATRVHSNVSPCTVSTVVFELDRPYWAARACPGDAAATNTATTSADAASSARPTVWRTEHGKRRVNDRGRTRAVRPPFVGFITVTGCQASTATPASGNALVLCGLASTG